MPVAWELQDAVADTVRPVTFAKYEQIVRNHAKPALGRLRLQTLTPAHVRGLYREKLDSGLSPSTVQYIHVTLNKALKQAVADGLIPRNVCEAVKPPRPQKREIAPLSPDQARRFLEACQGERLEALFVLAVHTGMRQGELLGLHWEDVDLEAGALRVRRALAQTNDGPVLTAPKGAKSRRRIKLTGAAVEALKRHKAAQNAERLRFGGLWEDRGLVFPNRTGRFLSPSLLTDGPLKRPLERAGLSPRSAFTTSGTRAPRSCSRVAFTPSSSRSYWAMRLSASHSIRTATCSPAWMMGLPTRWGCARIAASSLGGVRSGVKRPRFIAEAFSFPHHLQGI
ncbi:MAG: site-specific integrase [Actinomycetota bacterium]|nr:site-specific integrase [Actinomycetota bacterium]